MIGTAFISDREDQYLPGCRVSFDNFVRPFLSWGVNTTVIDDRDHRLGLSGAVQAAWDWARDQDLDYLLHVEEDFLFNEPFDPNDAISILEADKNLAQVVLKRQSWNPEEQRAGGIIECHPEEYTDHEDGDLRWASHKRIFSLNPCVIPRHIFEMGWPDGNEAEMTTNLVSLGYRFAFFGGRNDPPRVTHVGAERSIGWRL